MNTWKEGDVSDYFERDINVAMNPPEHKDHKAVSLVRGTGRHQSQYEESP